MLAKTGAWLGKGKSPPAKVAVPCVRAADPSKSPRPATKAKKGRKGDA